MYNEHGGNIYRYNKDIIDFSANINPLGMSNRLKRLLTKEIDRILYYPDPDSVELIKSIAKYWGIDEGNIVLGNGSSELIYLIVSAFKPKKVFIPIPTFSEYERASRAIGSKIQFKPPFIDGDMLFICNPNNPTGNLAIIPKFKDLRVIDEAFMDFAPDEKRHTMIGDAVKNKNIIVVRTFTKFFAIPGLRIGYLVAHSDTVTTLKRHQPPWNINSLAQMVCVMLEDKEYIKKTRRIVAEERAFLLVRLSNINGLKPFDSVVNFVLVKITNKNITSTFLKEKLIQRGILIRDCSNFRGLDNRYFRIAVRSRKENRVLINALKTVL